MAMRLGEAVGGILERAVQEITQTAERERQLSLDATRFQHAYPGFLRGFDSRPPERRLPYPGLPTEQQAAGAVADVLDESMQLCELRLTPDEVVIRWPMSLGDSRPVGRPLPAQSQRSVGVSETPGRQRRARVARQARDTHVRPTQT